MGSWRRWLRIGRAAMVAAGILAVAIVVGMWAGSPPAWWIDVPAVLVTVGLVVCLVAAIALRKEQRGRQ